MLLKMLRPGETLVRYLLKTMRSDKNGDVNKRAERCMLTAKPKNKNKNKTNKNKKKKNTKHHSNHGSTIC